MKPARLDWQTAVAAVALLGAVFFGCRVLFVRNEPVAPEKPSSAVMAPEEGAKPMIYHMSSTPAGSLSAGNYDSVQRSEAAELSLANQSGHTANLGIQQLDYGTLRTMQTQVIARLRQQIREYGVGADGVTEADLDRMLKNGQLPQ